MQRKLLPKLRRRGRRPLPLTQLATAAEQGKPLVSQVISEAAANLRAAIRSARAELAAAEKLMSCDDPEFQLAMAACRDATANSWRAATEAASQGERGSSGAVSAMVERLSRISSGYAAAAAQANDQAMNRQAKTQGT